jgi:DNA repair exonuclease SbcCD ATPase subunit
MLRPGKEETQPQPKRDDAQIYGLQQQVDELRRQLKENLARQQWFEETYKQNEGRVAQLQMAQERLAQDIAQSLHARQIDDGRTKALISDLAVRVEGPDKQLRDLRAQIHELTESRKNERDADAGVQRQFDDLQRQIREMNAHIAKVAESQKSLRELVSELQGSVTEAQQELSHVADLQRVEEQRLRRHGVELQGLFEELRQQFTELSARSQRVDDVRRDLAEKFEALENRLIPMQDNADGLRQEIDKVRTLSTEHYMTQQERLEEVRAQIDGQLTDMRGVGDQRTDRYMSRFGVIEERLHEIDQKLTEFPSRFEALERKDEVIGAETDAIEEWLVMRQISAMETVLDEVRKRREDRAPSLNPGVARATTPPPEPPAPGSVFNPAGLIRSVRDAKPPVRGSGGEQEGYD